MKKALYCMLIALTTSLVAMDDCPESPRTPTAPLPMWEAADPLELKKEIQEKIHLANQFEKVIVAFLEIVQRSLGRGKSKVTADEFTNALCALTENKEVLTDIHVHIEACSSHLDPTTPVTLTPQNFVKNQERFPLITKVTFFSLIKEYDIGTIFPGTDPGMPMNSIHVQRCLLEHEKEKAFDTIFFGPDTIPTVATRRVISESSSEADETPCAALARSKDEHNDKDAS